MSYNREEKWALIYNYPMYAVSDKGKVYSFGRDSLMTIQNKNGYMHVWLRGAFIDIQTSVHRLVAQEFIPNPENKPQVNHKNGIKIDNRVENLEWATHSENIRHAHKSGLCNMAKGKDHYFSKLTKDLVIKIRNRYKNTSVTQTELAEEYDIAQSTLNAMLNKKTWKHV